MTTLESIITSATSEPLSTTWRLFGKSVSMYLLNGYTSHQRDRAIRGRWRRPSLPVMFLRFSHAVASTWTPSSISAEYFTLEISTCYLSVHLSMGICLLPIRGLFQTKVLRTKRKLLKAPAGMIDLSGSPFIAYNLK